MEKQSITPPLSLREILGENSDNADHNIGIINETESWIYRRALDYLTVGFVTDIDSTEGDREARYEAYLNTIEADLAQYRKDVADWDLEHYINTVPKRWQTSLYDTTERRTDLPSVQTCEEAIVGPAARKRPRRIDILNIAHEARELYYDEALRVSRQLLEEKISFIRDNKQVGDDGLYFTHDGQSLSDIESRLQMVKDLLEQRNSQDFITNSPLINYADLLEDELYTVDNLGGLAQRSEEGKAQTTDSLFLVRSIGSTSVKTLFSID